MDGWQCVMGLTSNSSGITWQGTNCAISGGLGTFVFYVFASSVVCDGDDEIFLFTNCNYHVDQAILSVGL